LQQTIAMKQIYVASTSALLFISIAMARSPLRPSDPKAPNITIRWEHAPEKKLCITDSHLEVHPIFSINNSSLEKHFVPQDGIMYTKNKTNMRLDPTTITSLIETLLVQIKQKKKKYTDFTIIKRKNFSFKKQCGLLIVAFNDYPLILKLFVETPRTFFDYHAKGIESICFFYMSGGANRHVTGLTRIKNKERILEKAQKFENWKSSIQIPRKWFWLPNNPKYLQLTGKNIGPHELLQTRIPAVYAIIADCVDTQQKTSLTTQEQSNIILQMSSDLDLFIDAHRDNFVFTDEIINEHPKIIVLDTEHFPSIVGIKEPTSFVSYFEWYLALIKRCFFNCYLRHKKSQQTAQLQPHKLLLWE